MSVDKKDINDKIKFLVAAYNEANQYNRNQSEEVVGNGLNMTYEGRCVYLLRQIFNCFIEAAGQKINDGVVLSLVDSSTALRKQKGCLMFDSEKQSLTYQVPNRQNNPFSLAIIGSNHVHLSHSNSHGRIFCCLEDGNFIMGSTEYYERNYEFFAKFEENGLVNESFYKSSWSPNYFGNFEEISAEHHAKFDGDVITCQNNLNMGGQNIKQDFQQYGITSTRTLISPSIPGFGVLSARDCHALIFDDTLETTFPELADIANQHYNKISGSCTTKK